MSRTNLYVVIISMSGHLTISKEIAQFDVAYRRWEEEHIKETEQLHGTFA